VVTDVLFCIGPNTSAMVRITARLLGVYCQLGMSRTMKLMIKDRLAFANSIAPLLLLPVERIVLAHDQVLTTQVKTQLQGAFAWLNK